MINDILTILKNDQLLMNLINGTDKNSHIFPINTDYMEDCIIYNYYTVSSDKITEQSRLELIIITSNLNKSNQIEKRIKSLLLTLADKPLTKKILNVEVNGGGVLYDDARKKIHRTIYLNILNRSE